MARRLGNQNGCLSAIVALILFVMIGTALVDITTGRSYFNITQKMNLSQLIGRSDLNNSDWFNATASQQPMQLIPTIIQPPSEGELPGSQNLDLPTFLQGTPRSQGEQLPAFLQ